MTHPEYLLEVAPTLIGMCVGGLIGFFIGRTFLLPWGKWRTKTAPCSRNYGLTCQCSAFDRENQTRCPKDGKER